MVKKTLFSLGNSFKWLKVLLLKPSVLMSDCMVASYHEVIVDEAATWCSMLDHAILTQ